MIKCLLFNFIFLFSSFHLAGQNLDELKSKIASIASTKNVRVGVAIQGLGSNDALYINGDAAFPMQSVFKFHIAIVALSEVDKGNFSLEQMITIDTSELLPGLYSPIRDKYPNGVQLSLAEILAYTVSKSDNVGCDKLLKLLGGPLVVESYFHQLGFNQLGIKINEEIMQSNWDLQIKNWTTPKEANALLSAFYLNAENYLSSTSHAYLWQLMRETETGKNRLKGLLPVDAIVAHKTGWSGTNADGITAAVNNIGVVTLPSGQQFVISVFVTDSREDFATNERIIAEIAKAAWDVYLLK